VFFIDAFDRGRFLTSEDVAAYLVGRGVEPDLSHFAPSTVRETLCRCCRNLVHHYSATGSEVSACLFASFVEEFEATYQESTQ
jgi:hypothetical protein